MAEDMDKLRMRQATDTADFWLTRVIDSIDSAFEKGYAKQHPELVAAMLATAASDFRTTSWAASVDRLADALHSGLSNIG